MNKTATVAPAFAAATLLTGIGQPSISANAVSYGSPRAANVGRVEGKVMTPQETALFDAKIEAATAALRGDVRLNTQGVTNLEKRFDEMSARLAAVPTDLASLKATVAELPRKGFIIGATSGALALIAAISIFVQWALSAHLFSNVH